ncbi:hypothetical protein LTS07_006077 [Exophiala sideris]|uniref:Zn(2)-C6 fungal-type domain-containing protein n=1 Tax=Exophiala sideris TaxID=1016849 RepID=A0ABR0J5W8_9EURO|nr:hypothetical protein LTS07_006077 [Exophiala sideris]KAK5035566.1 hypothetical protein LTR13_005695 [Exophiala sideris]KAK5057202.1 hypothetical protein LTR69_007241 [Exophiala sideris]
MSATTVPPYPTDTPGLRINRACRNCVQIKAKCVPEPGPNSSVCQRCQRLGKVCTTPAPIPRHRGRNKSTRVAQLEEKINNLTSLLTSSKPADEVPTQPHSHAQQSLPTPPVSITHEPYQPCRHSRSYAKITTKPPPENSTSDDADKKGFFRTQLPSAIEERLFSDFRTYMNGYFPYVVIPPEVSSASVRENKPFLFRTCIAVACHVDPPVQRQLGEELFRYIGERMLLKGEKSLDLLQGILVLVSWKDLPASLGGSTRFELHVLSHEISSLEHIMSSGLDTALARAEALYTCLKRVGNLLDCFTKFPGTKLQYLPFMIWIHLLHAIIVIAKMSFLEVEGWDLQYVRTSETSFPASCTGLIAYLEAAARQCQGESQTPSPISARFNMSAEKLRQCLKWYENKIQAEAESMTSTEACVVPGLPPFDPALESFFEGFDDGLWADFTGDFGNTGMQF